MELWLSIQQRSQPFLISKESQALKPFFLHRGKGRSQLRLWEIVVTVMERGAMSIDKEKPSIIPADWWVIGPRSKYYFSPLKNCFKLLLY